MNEKKLGLPSVIAVGVGLIVATSCLMSLGQGAGSLGISFIIAMVIACFVNIMTALSLSELNALMPNLTGGPCPVHAGMYGTFRGDHIHGGRTRDLVLRQRGMCHVRKYHEQRVEHRNPVECVLRHFAGGPHCRQLKWS